MVPPTVNLAPYWGPITEVPADRRLREEHGRGLPPDNDVSEVWWRELRAWLDKTFMYTVGQPPGFDG